MNSKRQILEDLCKVFTSWLQILENMAEGQILTPLAPSTWTVKDLVAHLWTWQQASVARADAALHAAEPAYPDWWHRFGPDPEQKLDETNEWNFLVNRDRAWSDVYTGWRAQFQRYLALLEKIPERDLLEPGRYTWMGSYALADSARGSLGHHEEHLDMLLAWLKEHSDLNTGG